MGKTMSLRFARDHERALNAAVMAVLLLVALFYLINPAFAGTDTTFAPASTLFTNILQGSGGTLIAIVATAIGLVNLARGGFQMASVGVPLGVGIGVATGPAIVTSTITAII
ncbi:hypothetical protein [Sphingobium sp. B11D3A]|uniref:hypothetical protein n=1 Tax=Sphingobium sp. B11D3A TaxID=2940574 RepID=UPI002225AA13|nr:hypothetical protein [Sphingobium sp. B11D3A]MCW2393577.1 conjugal transfer pilus assembly protein TraA [Sphingobium sp. B11D3A]